MIAGFEKRDPQTIGQCEHNFCSAASANSSAAVVMPALQRSARHQTTPPDTTLLSGVGGMGSRASPVQSLAGLILGVITLVNKRIERPIIFAKNQSAAADGI